MKGLALRTVVLLVIAIIVMAIALWFLTYLFNFDALFLSNDQRILKLYSTCVLTYCASGGTGTNGVASDEVLAVGCLKSEAGKCVLSCAQVEKEVFEKNSVSPTFIEPQPPFARGAAHYCGQTANLTFEFSGLSLGGVVPLRSGEMDHLATKPQWVCKPVKIPFTDVDIDSIPIPPLNTPGTNTADLQYHGIFGPQNCVMLSKSEPDNPPVKYDVFGFKSKGGCFTGYVYDDLHDNIPPRDDILYTPIIQYDHSKEDVQKIYPSAIYVDDSFTTVLPGLSEPECGLINPKKALLLRTMSYGDYQNRIREFVLKYTKEHENDEKYRDYKDDAAKHAALVADSKRASVAEFGADPIIGLNIYPFQYDIFDFGNMVKDCKFRITYNGEKIKYTVYATPTFPGVDTLNDFVNKGEGVLDAFAGFVKPFSPDINNGFRSLKNSLKDFQSGTTYFFSQAGSCVSVTLNRTLESNLKISGSEKSEQVTGKIVTLQTDKLSYIGGETVKLTGKIETYQGPDREVKIEFAYGPLFLKFDRTTANIDGNFEWSFSLAEQTGSGKYRITTSYGGDKKEVDFVVT